MGLFDDIDEKFDEVYNKALSLLDYSLQSEKMLEAKLLKKGYQKSIVKEVLKKLKASHIINDEEYAKIYADNLVKYKYNGRNLIYLKLKQKNIKDEIINDIIKKIFTEYNEIDIAKKFILKNALSIKRLMQNNEYDKIKLKLINNGFEIQTVQYIIKNLDKILKDEGDD
jgi:regulatory protein